MAETQDQPDVAGGVAYSPEVLEAARQLVEQQKAAAPPQGTGPAATEQDIASELLAAGAEPAEVDTAKLLAMIQAQQRQLDKLLAEKRAERAPAVVSYADAIGDHLAAKAAANPAIHADPDYSWQPALETAARLSAAARSAADAEGGGDVSAVKAQTAAVRKFAARHARRHPQIDHGYVLELCDEADDAADELAA